MATRGLDALRHGERHCGMVVSARHAGRRAASIYGPQRQGARRRAVMGTRGKKETEEGAEVPRYYWHLGFTGAAFIGDAPHIALRPRIIITEDQITPLDNKTKLNSVRRAVTNMWFNDKWRGLVMGFCAWLADDDGHIRLAAGEHGQNHVEPASHGISMFRWVLLPTRHVSNSHGGGRGTICRQKRRCCG